VIGALRGYSEESKLQAKIDKKPEMKRLYARYLLDKFVGKCRKHADPSIRPEVESRARAKIAKRVAAKEAELKAEKESLSAFEGLVGPANPSFLDLKKKATVENENAPEKQKRRTGEVINIE